MPTLRSAARYYGLSATIARKAVLDAREARPRGGGAVAGVVSAHQMAGADLARGAIKPILAEQHELGLIAQRIDTEAAALLNSAAFVTELQDIERMLDKVVTDWQFDRLIGSLTQGAGRDAMSLEVATHPDLAWVRHVNPPCCRDCAILAGRVYRWSEGFERHPGCDCVHIPTTLSAAENLTTDPAELVARGLVTGLSKADLQLLDEGADLNQVVNVRKLAAHMVDGREVLVRRGRLTPAGILKEADGDGDRDRVLALIESNGYGTRRVKTSSFELDPEPLQLPQGVRDEQQTRINDLLGGIDAAMNRRAASAAGGSGQPPLPPSAPGAAMPDEPGPDGDRDAHRDYWRARRDQLEGPAFTAAGEPLDSDEVRFAERMVTGLGQRISWIPTGSNGTDKIGTLPANDFVWHTSSDYDPALPAGLLVEHKGLRADTPVDFKHIVRQIKKALGKNKRAHTVDNVVVDVGERDVDPNVIAEMADFYDIQPKPLQRLWLMSRGQLIRVLPK